MSRNPAQVRTIVAAAVLALLAVSVHAHEPSSDPPVSGGCVACALHHAPGLASPVLPQPLAALPDVGASPTDGYGVRPTRGGRGGPSERGPPAV